MIHTQYVTGYEGRQKTIYSRNDSFDIYLIGNEGKENMERITSYYSGILRHNRITNEINSFTFNPVPHIISLCCFQNILYYIHLTWNDQNVNCSIMKLNCNTIKISSTEVFYVSAPFKYTNMINSPIFLYPLVELVSLKKKIFGN